ncbi:efflux RND transporter periplasmic adaptor subunit [Variovorax terrae]|uniref:Efflux RND transporter periplasmic adaptor subunit n=1 Tax=Variovorax terrae TaxID=2923278 RepID=A0A9X2AM94_9BURK|nr:efflux RND transporter periplasmic adaptor subunit [Variovorax terrae]MCJ0763084.1 efflux RND transporter periplasmic adaptor subunit [Variovorax terrae]
MASKAIYSVVAVVGIAAASGAAWWYQNKPAAAPAASGPGPAAVGAQGPASAPGGGRAPLVEAARVETMRLADDAQAVGSLRSRQSVVLRPEVSGRITQLNFRDGDRVRKGQLLVQFDDQLPLAQVQQSQAELSIAQANHKRNQDLVAQSFISQRSVDESAANLEVAQAKLALAKATAARLRIVAPFDGIAGIRTVNVGDYLKDGSDIVNVEDIEAIYVDFRLPERFHTKVRKGQKAMVDIDALPGRKFTAMVQAIDPLLDANGRSVGIRGCIDNRQLQLRPGMFARVTSVFGERERAKVIPEEAIVPQGGRQFVLKLKPGPDADTRTTQRVEVKVGIRRPGRVEIVEGLEEGDSIIIAGQQRVQRDGTVVRVAELSRAEPARPGGGNAPAPSAPAAPAAAAAAASAPVMVPAALPVAQAPASGPNPCLTVAADTARGRGASEGAPRGPRGTGRLPA